MTTGSYDSHDPSRDLWTTEDGDGAAAFDDECSPTRVCRNAREFSFDGIAAEGVDLKTAWRDLLEREGKLNHSAESIHDLVFGPSTSD
jgi:hypothetical protein